MQCSFIHSLIKPSYFCLALNFTNTHDFFLTFNEGIEIGHSLEWNPFKVQRIKKHDATARTLYYSFVHSYIKYRIRSLSTVCDVFGSFSVLVVVSALLTYPLGFGSPFFRYYCGVAARPYATGQCSLGWSYMLAIMGVALSVFCPILWSFRWIKRDDVIEAIPV